MSDDVKEPVGLARGVTTYGDADFALYVRRAYAKSTGLSEESLRKPVIGIINTGSGFNSCHRLVPDLIDAIKRGVLASGGLPLVFPTISLGEPYLSPTSLMFRNLMAMDTEEKVLAQPMEAVVAIGGCDKNTPAPLMGLASANRPANQIVVGPMLTNKYHGERLGACTDCRRYWGKFRAQEISRQEIENIENRLATTEGTCDEKGTATTMAALC